MTTITNNFKYNEVSIDTMNTQVNVRLSKKIIEDAKKYSKKKGFSNIQEFIKEAIREKLYDDTSVTKDEINYIKRIIEKSEKNNLYKTEKELFDMLKSK